MQIYGTCEECQKGRPGAPKGGHHRDGVRARRAAHRHRHRAQRAASSTRARRRITQDARGRSVFQKLAEEEKEHLGTLEARYAQLLAADPLLETRPTFLFFKGAANGLFAEGAERLSKGVNDQQALLIGIRCERGSHRFFKKYGERFEDSEGKQIFMEFAEEESSPPGAPRPRIQEPGQAQGPQPGESRPCPASSICTSTRLRPTAVTPAELVDLAWRAGIRHDERDRPRHGGGRGGDRARCPRDVGMRFVPGHRNHRRARRPRRAHARLLHRPRETRRSRSFSSASARTGCGALGEMVDRLAEIGKPINRETVLAKKEPAGRSGRPMVARALVKAGHVADMRQAFDELIGEGKPAFVPRVGPEPSEVIGIIARAGGVASLAHPGLLKRDDLIPALVDAGLPALEAFHSDHDPETTEHYLALAERYGLAVSGGSDYHGEPIRRRSAFGRIGLPVEQFERLVRARGKQRTLNGGGALDRGHRVGGRHRHGDLSGSDGRQQRHALAGTSSIGIFSTMICLLSHSMMMFYFLGKGKAVREAAAEGGLVEGVRTSHRRARKPVFSIGTYAMLVTIVTGAAWRQRRHRDAAGRRPRRRSPIPAWR